MQIASPSIGFTPMRATRGKTPYKMLWSLSNPTTAGTLKKHTRFFRSVIQAVSFALGGRGKVRLEKGIFHSTNPVSGNVAHFAIYVDDKPLTTDALVPYVRQWQENRKKHHENLKAALARIDKPDALTGARKEYSAPRTHV